MNPRNWDVMAIFVSLERVCSGISAPAIRMWAYWSLGLADGGTVVA
jgi:hypothetical protein